MSHGHITRYTGEHSRITAIHEAEVLEPEPAHAGWLSFVAQRSVRAIAIAPRSRNIWLATWGGVLSWNRREELLYRRYSSEHGLAGNAVACLCLDQAEQPWAGHVEGGLSYFDGQRWQVYAHLQQESIRALTSGGTQGGVWAAGFDAVWHVPAPDQLPNLVAQGSDGTQDPAEALALLAEGDGLLLGNAWGLFYLQSGHEPVRVKPQEVPACTALARDADGGVWLGTPAGLYQLKGQVLDGPFTPGERAPVERILGLAAGHRRVWVWTLAGLAQWVDGQWQSVPWPETDGEPPAVRAIAASGDDNYLWVGTDDLIAGVLGDRAEAYWDLSLLPRHPEDQLNNLGRCAVGDADGDRVWIGMADGLVAFGPGIEWSLDARAHGSDVRALAISAANGGTLWMLTWPYGIDCILPASHQGPSVRPPSGLPLALAVGQDGWPVVATGRALWRMAADDLQQLSAAMPPTARCLAQAADGIWWLGTAQGAYQLLGGGWNLAGEQPGPVQAAVHALAVVQGRLWAATEAGLYVRQANGWILHGAGPQNQPFVVRALAAAVVAGELWLAREDGVVRYDPTTRAVRAQYTPADSGLASRRVTALVESAGALWIVTQAGISRLALS
jgi:ligand-binding sensor domain-containing protein